MRHWCLSLIFSIAFVLVVRTDEGGQPLIPLLNVAEKVIIHRHFRARTIRKNIKCVKIFTFCGESKVINIDI